jgi:hypothetical protein
MTTLAMEGTSPVAPSILFSPSAEDRKLRSQRVRMDSMIGEKLGPSIARHVAQLDVTAEDPERHGFYSSFVEFLMSPTTPLFQNAELRERGFATSQIVFASPTNVTEAGATPQALSTGEFSALSLWRLGKDDAAALDAGLQEVGKNTMPKREGPTQLDAHTAASYFKSISCLRSLNGGAQHPEGTQIHKTQFILSQASLMHNSTAVGRFCDKLHSLGNGYVTRAHVQPMTDCIVDDTGADVGHFVVVSVEAAM